MKNYEIITKTYWEGKPIGSKSTFLTIGKNIKEALSNLVNRSADFEMVSREERRIQIRIKEIKRG